MIYWICSLTILNVVLTVLLFKAMDKPKLIKDIADSEAYRIRVINRELKKSTEYLKLLKIKKWEGYLPNNVQVK